MKTYRGYRLEQDRILNEANECVDVFVVGHPMFKTEQRVADPQFKFAKMTSAEVIVAFERCYGKAPTFDEAMKECRDQIDRQFEDYKQKAGHEFEPEVSE